MIRSKGTVSHCNTEQLDPYLVQDIRLGLEERDIHVVEGQYRLLATGFV